MAKPLTSKIKEFKINASFDRYEHLDLYQILKPYKNLWGLKNFRQKNLEEYLGIQRTDKLSGKKLIKTYQDYLENGEIKNKESVLLHNHEDLIGLHKIYSLMSYPALLDKEFTLSSYFIENDHFVAHLNLDIQIPVSCNYEKSGISLTLDHSNAILTCPLENGHLKHYLKDYKNYYYLPMEDLVIHKSMKSFVDTTSIIRADKNNCYSKFTPGDSFLSAKTDVINYCADIIYYILSEK